MMKHVVSWPSSSSPFSLPRLTPVPINYPAKRIPVQRPRPLTRFHPKPLPFNILDGTMAEIYHARTPLSISSWSSYVIVCVLLIQDKAGLPLRSWATICFFCAKAPHAAVPSTNTCSGMIMTVRYSAVLLSLHNIFQCGCTFM